MISSEIVITRRPTTTLKTLPAASEVSFPGLFAWSPITSAAVTAALGADPGAWNVWRFRRLTPAPLHAAWFRRTTGHPLVYQVSDILTWLAAKRGERLTTLDTWRQSLSAGFDEETDDPERVRQLVRLYAEVAGPAVGDVRFTPAGFRDYLSSLSSV